MPKYNSFLVTPYIDIWEMALVYVDLEKYD